MLVKPLSILPLAGAVMAALALSACAPKTAPSSADDITLNREGGAAQCVLADWQQWQGKLRSSVPDAPAGLVFRFVCKECAATMDYRPDRVTFGYDEAYVITQVTCG